MRIRELIPWRSQQGNENALSRPEADPFFLFQHRMNRLFDDFLEGFDLAPFGRENGGSSVGVLSPKVDVAESNDSVQVTAELPGMKEEDIEVTVSDGNLVLRGEKKQEQETKEKNFHRVERSYGSFYRTIPLPADVDQARADATFKDGVLKVVLPKTETKPTGRKIEVKRQS